MSEDRGKCKNRLLSPGLLDSRLLTESIWLSLRSIWADYPRQGLAVIRIRIPHHRWAHGDTYRSSEWMTKVTHHVCEARTREARTPHPRWADESYQFPTLTSDRQSSRWIWRNYDPRLARTGICMASEDRWIFGTGITIICCFYYFFLKVLRYFKGFL